MSTAEDRFILCIYLGGKQHQIGLRRNQVSWVNDELRTSVDMGRKLIRVEDVTIVIPAIELWYFTDALTTEVVKPESV